MRPGTGFAMRMSLRMLGHRHQDQPAVPHAALRDDVIREVGGLTHIYPGKYLLQPDGNAAYDAEGAETKADLNALIAEYRRQFPGIRVVVL